MSDKPNNAKVAHNAMAIKASSVGDKNDLVFIAAILAQFKNNLCKIA